MSKKEKPELWRVIAEVPFSPATDFMGPGEGYQRSKPHPREKAEALMAEWKSKVKNNGRVLASDWTFRLEKVEDE